MYKSIQSSFIALLCSCFNINTSQAQDTTTEMRHPVSISAYAEIYYTQDLNHPDTHLRPAFIYSHNRTGEVSLNLALLKASYQSKQLRANIAFGTGSYMHANYSAESDVLQTIYEANVGVRLAGKSDLWLDVGVLPSHIGAESAIGVNNWTLTRGLAAENSTYFEAGAKLGYTSRSEKWYLALLFLNGWQRIQRANGNNTPAFGSQVTFTPNSGFNLNYSTYIGNDQPDSIKSMRYFQNLYSTVTINKRWALMAGIDVGLQKTINQTLSENQDIKSWYAPFMMIRFHPVEKVSITSRAELYQDPNGIVISSDGDKGAHLSGYSLNIDYQLMAHAVWRVEGRLLNGKERIFVIGNGGLSDHSSSITTTLAISF